MHMSVNRLQCDIQLHGCLLGHTLPEHRKTMWLMTEDFIRSPDFLVWKSALCDSLPSADGFRLLSVDGTMKIAMGVRRRETGPWAARSRTASRTLRGAVLDLAVVPSDDKPHVVASALTNVVHPNDRESVHWVVGDNASAALYAALLCSFPSLRGVALEMCHLPMKYEAVACQQVQRVLSSEAPWTWTCLNPFGVTRSGRGVLLRPSLPRVTAPGASRCLKSAEAWSGLAEWIRTLAAVATLFLEETKNKHFWRRKSRLRLLMAAATFPRYQWYLNSARLRSTVTGQQASLLGTGTCGNEALHAEHFQAGVQCVAAHVQVEA